MPLHIYILLILCGSVGPTLVHQRVRDSCLIRARCVCIEIDTSSMQTSGGADAALIRRTKQAPQLGGSLLASISSFARAPFDATSLIQAGTYRTHRSTKAPHRTRIASASDPHRTASLPHQSCYIYHIYHIYITYITYV